MLWLQDPDREDKSIQQPTCQDRSLDSDKGSGTDSRLIAPCKQETHDSLPQASTALQQDSGQAFSIQPNRVGTSDGLTQSILTLFGVLLAVYLRRDGTSSLSHNREQNSDQI